MTPENSVVVPVCNEAENVGPLAQEIAAALAARDFEILFVDQARPRHS
jgi:glycosyltransferase involved in cell wall biosynthesis